MEIRYVMLLAEGPAAAGTTRGRVDATAAARGSPSKGKTKVAVESLKPREVADIRRDKRIVAAPVMPMRLIAPRKVVKAKPATGGVAWGVRAVGADQSQFNGKGVIVAVLDTGIDPDHPAFAGVKLRQKNFTTAADNDTDGHGTHCAGTIFGRDVNGIRIGVAIGVKEALIGKVLGKGGGGSDQIVQAMQWAAAEGAHVISMSLGIDFPGAVEEFKAEYGLPTNAATSLALEGYRANVRLFERMASLLAAQSSFAQPVMVVAASGNESERPTYVIAASPPAVADGFVAVAAMGESTKGFDVAEFSNSGAQLSAPGVSIQSAKRGGGLTHFSGTSMAAPHVAGVAALWAQKLIGEGRLDSRLLESQLIAGATMDGVKAGLTFDDVGAGMVQAP